MGNKGELYFRYQKINYYMSGYLFLMFRKAARIMERMFETGLEGNHLFFLRPFLAIKYTTFNSQR